MTRDVTGIYLPLFNDIYKKKEIFSDLFLHAQNGCHRLNGSIGFIQPKLLLLLLLQAE